DAIAEIHHLDEAEVVIKGDDGVDDGPNCEPDVPAFSFEAGAALNQAAKQKVLADESTCDRQPAERQHENRHHRGHARRFLAETAEVVNVIADNSAPA